MKSKYSEIDLKDYCRLVETSLPIQRRYQLFLWSRGELQTFLPHSTLLCAVGDLTQQGYRLERFSEYPEDHGFFNPACTSFDGFLSRLLAAWRLNSYAPVVLSSRAGDGEAGLALDRELGRLGLDDCSAHGLSDNEHGIGAFFLFLGGLSEPRHVRAHRLAMMVPHLCAALHRVAHLEHLASMAIAENHLLSAREAEIMRWIRAGKTNQEIGQILDISPYTVKNHVQKILRKLNATNRAQAAGKTGATARASVAAAPAVRLVRE